MGVLAKESGMVSGVFKQVLGREDVLQSSWSSALGLSPRDEAALTRCGEGDRENGHGFVWLASSFCSSLLSFYASF